MAQLAEVAVSGGGKSAEVAKPGLVTARELGHRLHSVPPATESLSGASRRHLQMLRDQAADDVQATEHIQRPLTREDCVDGERPCPWVGCKYNLFLDAENGSIRYAFPDREPGDMPPDESCALDVADRGGATLEEVGDVVNVTRERIRQMEAKAIESIAHKAKRKGFVRELAEHARDGGLDEGRNESPLAAASEGSGGGGAPEYSEERPDATLRPLFHEEGRAEDDCERVYATYDRAVRERDALARGELANLGGFPLNPSQARAVSIVREWAAERGRGPFVMELADLLGIQGETEASRRANMTTRMQGLREAGLVMYSRDRGFTIVEPRPCTRIEELQLPSEELEERASESTVDPCQESVVADAPPAVSPSAGATLENGSMSNTHDESSLTDKQRAILAGYRAGESCADIAANVGSPVESVQSTATKLRALGFDVPRASSSRREKTTPKPHAAIAEPGPKLSPKQAKVLVAVKAGKSEKQIAAAMRCTPNAAKAVVTVLRRKGALPRTHVGEAISRAFKEHPKPKRSRSGDAVVDSLQERIESLVAEERMLAEKRQKLEAARDALASE